MKGKAKVRLFKPSHGVVKLVLEGNGGLSLINAHNGGKPLKTFFPPEDADFILAVPSISVWMVAAVLTGGKILVWERVTKPTLKWRKINSEQRLEINTSEVEDMVLEPDCRKLSVKLGNRRRIDIVIPELGRDPQALSRDGYALSVPRQRPDTEVQPSGRGGEWAVDRDTRLATSYVNRKLKRKRGRPIR